MYNHHSGWALVFIRGVAGSTRKIFYDFLSEQTPDSITIGH